MWLGMLKFDAHLGSVFACLIGNHIACECFLHECKAIGCANLMLCLLKFHHQCVRTPGHAADLSHILCDVMLGGQERPESQHLKGKCALNSQTQFCI